jgi:2-dehydropantoate 2-reductase
MTKKPQSLIVGPGAIGNLVCAHIQKHSQVWVHRHKPNLELPNLAVTSEQSSLHWQLLEDDTQAIDLIWVCCKANHSLSNSQELLTRYPDAIAILLHNGMGPQQALAKQFPGRVIFAATTNAVFKDSDALFHQKAFGTTLIGYPSDQESVTEDWATTIAAWPGNMNFQVESNIEISLWKKLAINAVINPLTAYYGIKNGDLLEARYQESIASLCLEVTETARSEQVELPSPLIRTIYDVIKLTAENYSSMQQDVEKKQTTEVKYILGFLLECALKHQLKTPLLNQWYETILSCQESYRD